MAVCFIGEYFDFETKFFNYTKLFNIYHQKMCKL